MAGYPEQLQIVFNPGDVGEEWPVQKVAILNRHISPQTPNVENTPSLSICMTREVVQRFSKISYP